MQVLPLVCETVKNKVISGISVGKLSCDKYNKILDIDENNDQEWHKKIFLEALKYIETIESILSGSDEPWTVQRYSSLIAETLLRHAESMDSSTFSSKDQRLFSALALLFLLIVENESDHKEHSTFSESSFLNIVYSNLTLYGRLIKSAGYCLKKILTELHPDSNEESLKTLRLGLNILLCIIRQIHCQTPGTQIFAYPRKICLQLLVCCGFAPEDIWQASFNALIETSLSSLSCEKKRTFYKNVACLFEKLLLDQTKCPFETCSELGIASVLWDTVRLREFFFSNFLVFYAKCAHYLPCSERLMYFKHLLFYQSKTGSSVSKKELQSEICGFMSCITVYYSAPVRLDYIPWLETWNCDVEVLKLLIKREEKANTLTLLHQLQALFTGLDYLIDHISHNEKSDDEILNCYRALSECVVSILDSKQGLYRHVLIEMDRTLCTAVTTGWKHLINKGIESIQHSGKGGFLFCFFLTQKCLELFEPQNQLLWNFFFDIFEIGISSLQQLGLRFYALRHLERLPLCLESLLFCFNHLRIEDTDEWRKDVSCLFGSRIPEFSDWYQQYREIVYRHFMKSICSTLASLLRDCEVGASLSSQQDMENTDSEILLAQIAGKDRTLYRHKLHSVVGVCFKAFGAEILLRLPYLSLENLCTTPLSSPSFAYVSNSWVIPFLNQNVCQDQLSAFLKRISPLIQSLESKSHQIPKDATKKLELQNYQRLNEQLWSLLPRFMDQASDILEVFSDKDEVFVNLLLSHLNVPAAQESICKGLIILSFQLSNIIDPEFLQVTGRPHSIPSTIPQITSFFRCTWTDALGHVKDWGCLQEKANKLMGSLVVRYLQMKVSTNMTSSQSDHVSRFFSDAIEHLSILCSSELLERNLVNFNAAWISALDESVFSIMGNVPSGKSPAIKLSPSQSAALVDVCVGLMYRLPNHCVYNLFLTFVKLIKDGSCILANVETLSHQKLKSESSNSFFSNDLKPAAFFNETLNHILRKSYKGLQSSVLRLVHGKETDMYLHSIKPQEFMDIWKSLIHFQKITQKTITSKFRVNVLSAMLKLFCRLKVLWDDLLDKQKLHQMIEEMITNLIPEVLIGFSDVNKSTRRKAVEILHFVLRELAPAPRLITFLLPGFASEVAYVRSSTTTAFISLLRSYGDGFSEDKIKQLLDISILLLKDKNKCAFRSALKLIRTLQRFLPEAVLLTNLSRILNTVLASPCCAQNRLSVRYMIEKLIGRFGNEAVEIAFPASHLPLLSYVSKGLRKRKGKRGQHKDDALYRNCEALPMRSLAQVFECTDQQVPCSGNDKNVNDMWDSTSPSTRKMPDLLSLLQTYRAEGEASHSIQHTKKRRQCNHLSDENSSDDFTSSVGHEIDFTSFSKKPCLSMKRNEAEGLSMGPNGRLVIDLKGDEQGGKRDRKAALTKGKIKNKVFSGTATRLKELEAIRDTRATYKLSKIHKAHVVEKSSHTFKSKKALGDVSCVNGVAPYSYIRLNPKLAKEKYRSTVLKGLKNELRIKKQKIA